MGVQRAQEDCEGVAGAGAPGLLRPRPGPREVWQANKTRRAPEVRTKCAARLTCARNPPQMYSKMGEETNEALSDL